MTDPTPTPTPDAPPVDPAPTDPAPSDPPPVDPPADPDGSDALGDAGKKALDAMKAKWKAAETKAQEAASRADAAEAKAQGTEAEHAQQLEAKRIQDEALSKANERILKAEVRANAASKLADPADALRFIDLSEFEVGSDGEVDSSAIAQAIDDLITSKPYLAAQSGGRFQGDADGGARKDATKVAQLTRAELASMTPEAIDQARLDGRLNTLLGIT